MSEITYDCPNCLTHYVIYDGKEPMALDRINDLSEMVRKQQDEGSDCKKCRPREDGIRTTFEMDGLYTTRDLQDRFYVMKPCLVCGKYTKQDMRKEDKPCIYCGGGMGIASTYWSSLRTFREGRRLTAADKKKMGA